jgi:hypothetical protein
MDIQTCRECGGAALISAGVVLGLREDDQEDRDLRRRRQ